jgi:hypothetical protein
MHFPAIRKRLIPFGDHPVPLIRSRGRSLDVHPGKGDEFAFSLKPGCGVAQWPGCLGIRCQGSPQPLGSEANESGRVADPTSGVWPRKQEVWAVEVDAGPPRLLGEMGCPEEECEDVQLSPDGQFAVWAANSNSGSLR